MNNAVRKGGRLDGQFATVEPDDLYIRRQGEGPDTLYEDSGQVDEHGRLIYIYVPREPKGERR